MRVDASIPPSLARSHAGLCSTPCLAPFTPSSWLLLLFVHKPMPTLCRQWLYHEVVERHFFFGKGLSSCAGTRTRGVCEAEGAGARTCSSRALDLGHLELRDPPLLVQFIPLFNHLRLKKNTSCFQFKFVCSQLPEAAACDAFLHLIEEPFSSWCFLSVKALTNDNHVTSHSSF